MKEELRQRLLSLQSFETEEAYRASPSLNYSTLKLIPDGPQCLVADHYEKKGSALTIGDYVDKYFTDRDLWRETYDVERRSIKLSDSLELLLDSFVKEKNFKPSMDQIYPRSRELGLWTLFSRQKIEERIPSEFFEKLKLIETSDSKIMLSASEYDKAMNAIGNIKRSNKAMALITEDDDSIVIPQFKFEFDFQLKNGHVRRFRVMFDFLKFLINARRIIGIDVKSGSVPAMRFGHQFLEFRYDIQGQLYSLGMQALVRDHLKDWVMPRLSDFKFLYSPKLNDSTPIIASMSGEFPKYYNYIVPHNGKNMYGFRRILDDADWYLTNQEFENHRIIAESGNEVDIMQLIQ